MRQCRRPTDWPGSPSLPAAVSALHPPLAQPTEDEQAVVTASSVSRSVRQNQRLSTFARPPELTHLATNGPEKTCLTKRARIDLGCLPAPTPLNVQGTGCFAPKRAPSPPLRLGQRKRRARHPPSAQRPPPSFVLLCPRAPQTQSAWHAETATEPLEIYKRDPSRRSTAINSMLATLTKDTGSFASKHTQTGSSLEFTAM